MRLLTLNMTFPSLAHSRTSLWRKHHSSPVEEMTPMQASNTLDQLRMCLAAGLSVPAAVHEVACLPDAHSGIIWLDQEFVRNPVQALRQFQLRQPTLGNSAHLLERSFVSGAPLHAALGTLSEQLRNAVTQEITRKVRAVGVKAVLPLGLCFLPAFVLLTVVPIAVGLFATLSW